MSRKFLCTAALALLPMRSWAEPTVTPSETLIRLKVQPMAAPKPALRYLLLPDLKELSPGNPIPNYLKTLLYQDSNPREGPSRAALLQVDRAARMDKPDWQILLKVQTEGFNLLLPDVQKMRALASGLRERFRTEIAENRLDDALVTAKTMFAMARHMGEHPTLIGDLVAIAISTVAIVPLEEMLERPGCPNLYWALTNLPSPFISLDKGLEGERMLFLCEIRDLDETAPMSVDQIKKFADHIDKLYSFDGSGSKRKKTWAYLKEKAGDAKWVESARKRLVETGIPDERLRQFPAAQVIMLDEKREFEVRRDEYTKLYSLPTWQVEEQVVKFAPVNDDSVLGFFLPATHKVRRAQGRLEQRIALLRHVEALRMYAAEHDGKLPAKLSDFTVPLPADPFTGKPIRYNVEGDTAHFRGSPPAPEEKSPAYNVHYQVTIKK
jgi:hypothetical protein